MQPAASEITSNNEDRYVIRRLIIHFDIADNRHNVNQEALVVLLPINLLDRLSFLPIFSQKTTIIRFIEARNTAFATSADDQLTLIHVREINTSFIFPEAVESESPLIAQDIVIFST